MDRFPGFEAEALSDAFDRHCLCLQADQIAFNSAGKDVVAGIKPKFPNVKVASQLAINPLQKIEVKGGGNTPAVIISLQHQVDVFFEVETDQHDVAIVKGIPEAAQKMLCLGAVEVADVRAQEQH